jgi:hypothetical protein
MCCCWGGGGRRWCGGRERERGGGQYRSGPTCGRPAHAHLAPVLALGDDDHLTHPGVDGAPASTPASASACVRGGTSPGGPTPSPSTHLRPQDTQVGGVGGGVPGLGNHAHQHIRT